ncbi:Primase C terminal 2 (PriCT-2) [Shimia gijangensis]|uniref:Primase C terminal 2 (PriCT-2) n=1 Tax=Shimia gijangensis TaxID=1470563 RepID=A0A1M6LHG9_9RHOB|nr:bifunctional DNA primase/polymerase [Shimia gijangensis]SHJ70644.1 Primase C terminal 2 (PriCT-2) [Shimia gijangensis]
MTNTPIKQSNRKSRNLVAALSASKAGCPVFPCNPKDKSPFVKWKTAATTDQEEIFKLWDKYPGAMPGLVTGAASGFTVVDLDVKNGKNGVKEFERLGLNQNDAGAAVKTAGGGLHLYFLHADGVRNSQDKVAPGIDVRGEGGYVIAPGAVSNTGEYELVSGDLGIAKMVDVELPEVFLPQTQTDRLSNMAHGIEDPEKIRRALSFIPNDQSYDSWMRVIMACKAGFSGSSEGLTIVQQWCADYPGYDPEEVAKMWNSIEASREGGITVASLFAEANEHGWNGDIDDMLDDDLEEIDGEDDPTNETIHRRIKELNDRYALVRMGSKVVIAEFKRSGDIDFLATNAFRELYSNRKHGRTALGSAWITHPKRRTYEGGLVFKPDGNVPADTLNLWTGWRIQPDAAADCSLIIDHISDVVAAGNKEHADYIFSWLADIVQTPAKKPGVALVLKGKKGVGKDTLAEIMKMIIGRRHCAHVPATERLTGRFNSAFATAILIHVEEAIWGGQRESKGVVQSLITSPEMPLERKNVDTVQVDSFCRLLFSTNESWAVPATADERRYAVFEVSPCHRNDRKYFGALYSQIENGGLKGFLAFLESWVTPSNIEIRNPPQTKGLMEQKLSGLRGVDRWWYEVLCEGEGSFSDTDFEETSWENASLVVRRDDLRRVYENWMQQHRFQGEALGPAEFGEAIKKLCSRVSPFRPSEDGRRPWKYRFPILEECRSDFLSAMGGSEEGISWDS